MKKYLFFVSLKLGCRNGWIFARHAYLIFPPYKIFFFLRKTLYSILELTSSFLEFWLRSFWSQCKVVFCIIIHYKEGILNSDAIKVKSLICNEFQSNYSLNFRHRFQFHQNADFKDITKIQWIFGLKFYQTVVIWLKLHLNLRPSFCSEKGITQKVENSNLDFYVACGMDLISSWQPFSVVQRIQGILFWSNRCGKQRGSYRLRFSPVYCTFAFRLFVGKHRHSPYSKSPLQSSCAVHPSILNNGLAATVKIDTLRLCVVNPYQPKIFGVKFSLREIGRIFSIEVGEGGPPGDNFHKIGVIMLKKDGTYANSC